MKSEKRMWFESYRPCVYERGQEYHAPTGVKLIGNESFDVCGRERGGASGPSLV